MGQKDEIAEDGFMIVKDVYTPAEIEKILKCIGNVDSSRETFRKSADLFAIRRFLKEVPEAVNFIFNDRLKSMVSDFFGKDYFVVKSIYFDKPETSNWFVPYHQDLTISVNKKIDLTGFGPWTVKQDQFAVQPPLDILRNIFTIRIHLDTADENNGALKVVTGSHRKDIYRPEMIDWNIEKEVICVVPKGGVMIMKPLLLHGSNKTTNNQKRRVIHIEFSNLELPYGIEWAEKKRVKD